MFITFEGIDGSGKSTQCKLLADSLRAKGKTVLLTREPGGTPAAEQIRALLVSGTHELQPETETLLHSAARAEHVAQVIKPTLARGEVVISDRFLDSTLVYQGKVMGVDESFIISLHQAASGGLLPQRTFLLDIDEKTSYARAKSTAGAEDRYENFGLEFQRKLRAGFLSVAQESKGRIVVIPANAGIEAVHARVMEEMSG